LESQAPLKNLGVAGTKVTKITIEAMMTSEIVAEC
jgi:hypothetical protein